MAAGRSTCRLFCLLAGSRHAGLLQLYKRTQTFSKLRISYYAQKRAYCSVPYEQLIGYRFSKHHEWVTLDGNHAMLGISNYAQDQLGEVTFADLPDEGTVIKRDEAFGALESVKAAADLISPISGTVTKVNSLLQDDSEIINKDPYGQGWIIKVHVPNADEFNELLSPEEYEKFLKEEA